MKKSLLVVTLFISGVLSVIAAPTLPDKCQVFYPDVLMSALVKESEVRAFERSSDFGQKKEPRDKRFWVVFSDRDDNTTYTAPDGATKYMSLSLNETLRIAQIKNGYALVYSEPQEDIAYPMISQHAECKGWIPMKKLLLWHSSPTDDHWICYKALLCVNLDQQMDSNLGRLFKNPSNKSKFEQVSTDMVFYFVMKREGNMALLAKTHSLEGRSDQMLLGWVDEQSYVAWNQRACLEPTWDIKDVEYFADENVQAAIYKEADLEDCATRISFKRKQSEKYDPHLYRMHPDHLRFPLLDKKDGLYHCSTFAPSGDGELVVESTGTNEVSDLDYSEAQLRELTNINIGIVIDGTASMEKFYPAVKEAIKESCTFFSSKKYKVKVGAVIYRDYLDGDEYVAEKYMLTSPGNEDFYNWLDRGGAYGIKSHRLDRTFAEAMYKGINVAIDELGFRPGQSNILLVVGDCGNDREDSNFTREDIINKLVEKNISLMGFQVRMQYEDAYDLFNSQLQSIMKESLEKNFAKLKSDIKVKFKEVPNGRELENDAKSVLYVGSHSFPELGSDVESDLLSLTIQNAVKRCSESVKHKIDLLTSFNAGGFKANTTSIDTGVDVDEEWLKQTLGDRFESIKESNSLLSFKGYVKVTHSSGRDFFKPVVFITSDELNLLIERLAPVNDAAVVQSDDRVPYVNAMKELIRSLIPGITDAEMNSMGNKAVMNMVAGLPESADALKGFTISEIASKQAVSLQQYALLVNDFKRKFTNLKNLKKNPYKYTRDFNGFKYYWLPIEDLP